MAGPEQAQRAAETQMEGTKEVARESRTSWDSASDIKQHASWGQRPCPAQTPPATPSAPMLEPLFGSSPPRTAFPKYLCIFGYAQGYLSSRQI